MSKLNKDVLFLIFEKLHDRNSLYSCLLVNKTWCETVVPILWKNPWKYLKEEKARLQLGVIISHLSDEARNILSNQGIKLSKMQQKPPLLNYIRFCRYLKLCKLDAIIYTMYFEPSKQTILRNEILKLLVSNTRFTHIYIPPLFNYPILLIPGAERCFSELKFLQCYGNHNILEGLARISKSIKKLECFVQRSINSGVIKLIEAQRNLNDVNFNIMDKSFWKTFEESLINHADTIKYLKIYWKPITNILLSLVNLVNLELNISSNKNWDDFNSENVSFPNLQILRAQWVPSKILANLIENTGGHLIEIEITCEGFDDKRLIRSIYQTCPNLKYLKLLFNNNIILELEKLLINCHQLNGLVIVTDKREVFDWHNLFKILVDSSPTSLFMFKFKPNSLDAFKLESLRFFFDSWKEKGRHPILLQTIAHGYVKVKRKKKYFKLFGRYKTEGIIEKYDHNQDNFKEFEWIKNY